jgi:hypothetical protein
MFLVGRSCIFKMSYIKDAECVRGKHIDREETDLRRNIAEVLTELGYQGPAVVQV